MKSLSRNLALFVMLLVSTELSFAQTSSSGEAAWDQIYEVLSHPRCANCHVGDDHTPRWSGPSYESAYGIEPGGWMYHGMHVKGGISRIGNTTLPCSTCHQEENTDTEHGPPGAHAWALAPVEMEWFGKSSSEVCIRLKSPQTNGNRSIEEVADHVDNDELVHWGWEPGPGREPAPYDRKSIAELLRVWGLNDAPCPDGSFDLEAYLNGSGDTQ